MTIFYQTMMVFTICSIVGFIVETVWCLLKNRHYESRKSLLYGPFSVVYGIGGTLLTVALRPFRTASDLIVFTVAFVTGTATEYICSFCQERIWGTVSWDYSNFPMNIHGRVCLLYSVFWGVLGILWNKHMMPFFAAFAELFPVRWYTVLSWVFFWVFLIDALLSAVAVGRMCERIRGVPANDPIRRYFDRRYPDEKLKKVYANMKFIGDGPK